MLLNYSCLNSNMPRSIYLSGEIHLIGFGKKPCPTSSLLSITLKNAGSGCNLSPPSPTVVSPFTIVAKPIATMKILFSIHPVKHTSNEWQAG